MLKNLLMVTVLLIFSGPLLCLAADAPSGMPEAFLPESIFEFEPVLEGTRIAHNFILHNP